jgi:NADPH:quinone reductase-like Zn-dependent oxidoreductase
MKQLGADVVIDYTTQAFEERVSDVDVVLDLVGGDTQNRSFRVLKRDGLLISPVSAPSMTLANDYGVTPINFATRSDGAQLALIAELFDCGHLTVDVEVFPLSEAQRAVEKSLSRRGHGRLVLDPSK